MAKAYLPNIKSWPVTTLEANIKDGYIIKSIDGRVLLQRPMTTCGMEGISWLKRKEITKNNNTIIVSTTERYITAQGLAQSAAKLLPPGTVMLTKRAPVGVYAVNAVPMSTNQGFLKLQSSPSLRPLSDFTG